MDVAHLSEIILFQVSTHVHGTWTKRSKDSHVVWAVSLRPISNISSSPRMLDHKRPFWTPWDSCVLWSDYLRRQLSRSNARIWTWNERVVSGALGRPCARLWWRWRWVGGCKRYRTLCRCWLEHRIWDCSHDHELYQGHPWRLCRWQPDSPNSFHRNFTDVSNLLHTEVYEWSSADCEKGMPVMIRIPERSPRLVILGCLD